MKTPFIMIAVASLLGFAGSSVTASSDVKEQNDISNEQSANDYRTGLMRCESLSGNPKEVCVAQAKAALVYAEEDHKARYLHSLEATTEARKAIAEADYGVEKARCGGQSGILRESCLKEAKANLLAAITDAKAEQRISEARTDTQEDKRSADYRVALDRCDSQALGRKQECVAEVKAQFGR